LHAAYGDGPTITGWLEDPAIVEIMLDRDDRLWIDRLAGGLADSAKRLSAADGERIVRLVAHHVQAEVHPASPRVSAKLPGKGERFEGLKAYGYIELSERIRR
jgi:type IV secretion system protein TrbB